jgi:hypothetical protein
MARTSLSLALVLAFFASSLGAAARAADVVKNVAAGVTMTTRKTTTPWVIHVLKVDLTVPGVRLGATTSAQRQRTTSSYAKLVNAAAAVNGCFFSYSTYATTGLAVGNGVAWSDTADNNLLAAFAFDSADRVELRPQAELTRFDAAWMKGVVSGRPMLVTAGTKLATNPSYPSCATRNPRTAVGLSRDKKTVIIAVVDGRSSLSLGMTCTELATLMSGLGAYDAVNLDGGGSTDMYVRGVGVVNTPSDGTERVVGNHLAVFAPVLGTVATVKGLVYAAPNRAQVLKDATVTLAGTGTDVTDALGQYQLQALPGTLSVKVSRPGYTTKTVTATVATGATVTLDVGLAVDPNADFDADGVPDTRDNCAQLANADQLDTDHDGLGDVCDGDDDGDGLADEDDNCPLVANADQLDTNGDGVGDACSVADAGVVEPLDAGASDLDAGVADFGVVDEADAGDDVLQQTAVTGCATSPGLVLGAAVLVLARRRFTGRPGR